MKAIAAIVLIFLVVVLPSAGRWELFKSSSEKRQDAQDEFNRFYDRRWYSAEGEQEFTDRLDEHVSSSGADIPWEAYANTENAGWGATALLLIGDLVRRVKYRRRAVRDAGR